MSVINQPVEESEVGSPDQKPKLELEVSSTESDPSQKSKLGLI